MKRLHCRLLLVLPLLGACATSSPSKSEGTRVGSGPKMSEFLEQYASTFRFRLGQPSAIKISPDGKSVLFLRSDNRSFIGDLYELDLSTGKERVLLTADKILEGSEEELSEEEKARRERMRSAARGIASYALTEDGQQILVPLSGRLFLIERSSTKIRELPSEGGYPVDPVLSPDGKKLACVREGELYVVDLASNTQKRITQSTNPEHITHGLAEFVAQEEMHRFHGFWWSPDSTQIVFQRTDTSELETMHIMDPKEPAKAPKTWPYPRPGKKNAKVDLFVVSSAGGEPVRIAWDQSSFPYLATVVWSKGAPLTLVVQNRRQTEEAILTADPRTGATTELFRERDEAWLNLDQKMPRWLSDGQRFLWKTERNGGPELELRDREGKPLRSVTDVKLGLRGLIDLDESTGHVVVRASDKQSEEHIFRVPIDGGAVEALTDAPGIHAAVWSPSHSVWVHSRDLLDGTRDHRVLDGHGKLLATIRSVTEAPLIQAQLELTEVEGKDRSYSVAILRPEDHSAIKRYPVIVYVYGGPGFHVVNASPYSFMLMQWFANQGFIVVSIDGRGTPGKGRAWERAIRGNFIEVPLEDQVDALHALGEKYREMDMKRVGIFGWSFGGYFSCMAVMQHPEVFRVGVAGAPVTDWLDYDTHYTERYLGLPDDNPDGYRASSVLEYASKLERPLLIIHGTADDNVYLSHSIKLVDELFRAGKRHDFLPLSGFTHMVPDPQVTTRLYTTILDYFDRHLGGPSL